MNGLLYIKAKQAEWAKNQGLDLIGSKGVRGMRVYTPKLEDNLFRPLLNDVQKAFENGDGKELDCSKGERKMQALHSSSALAVNVFQYWKSISAVQDIAIACGLCRSNSDAGFEMKFEEKLPTLKSSGFPPNIDVAILTKRRSKTKVFAVESKFSEPYGERDGIGLRKYYIDKQDFWQVLPNLRKLAGEIYSNPKTFRHLDSSQLIKHILALKRLPERNDFTLLYLWYDVFGEEGKHHQEEIARFADIAKKDGIDFKYLSYQKLIVSLAQKHRENHEAYIRYLTERYL